MADERKPKLKWRDGRYNSSDADCGRISLTVSWKSSKEGYSFRIPGMNLEKGGFPGMTEAQLGAEDELKAQLERGLKLLA